MDTIRVDGNDVLAVYSAVTEARRRAIADSKPVIVEAMTYRCVTHLHSSHWRKTALLNDGLDRVGHHSTSDDSFAYRARQEVEDWKKIGKSQRPSPLLVSSNKASINSKDNPLHRMRKYLESKGWWSAEEEESLKTSQKKEVLSAFQAAEKLDKPSLTGLFTDVYDETTTPWNLVRPHPPFVGLMAIASVCLQNEP